MKTEIIETRVHALRSQITTRDPQHVEDIGNRLRAAACRINAASWQFDTAQSMLRKAKAGYRSSSVLGDTPWSLAEYELKAADALRKAQALLAELGDLA